MPESAPITAVVVNHNAGELLSRCVDSLLASDAPVRVELVDNASTDGSVEAVERRRAGDPRLRVRRNASNAGFARANNQALRELETGYALLLNPDCAVEPGALSALLAAVGGRPDVGMAGGLLLDPDGSEQAGCRRRIPKPGNAAARAFGLQRLVRRQQDFVLAGEPLPAGPAEVEAISGAFMLVRRTAIEAVGLLDEGFFLHCEDLDWCLRFAQAGQRILFVPGAVAIHDRGGCSRLRPFAVQWHLHRGMWRFHRKHYAARTPAWLNAAVAVGIGVRLVAVGGPRALRTRLRGR